MVWKRKPEWLERKFKRMILRLREMPRTGRKDRRQRNSMGIPTWKGVGEVYGHVGAQRDLTG